MNVLVACEESQRVCSAFRAKGHNAFSCDLMPCSGGFPEYHIQQNVLSILNPERFIGICFNTCDGDFHRFDKWDLIIAFPPCTYLTVTGNRWFNVSRYGRVKRQAQWYYDTRCLPYSQRSLIASKTPLGLAYAMAEQWG